MGRFFEAVGDLNSGLRNYRRGKRNNDSRQLELAEKSFSSLVGTEMLDKDDLKLLDFMLKLEGATDERQFSRR